MKFGTSFVLTRRKVRELHPVSRHVRITGVTASSWGCPLFSKVSGKLEAGERRVRCAVERGSPSHTQSRLHAGWGASVIDFLSALLPECVCVCADCVPVLRVNHQQQQQQQPVRSTLTCPLLLWSLYDPYETHRSAERRCLSFRIKERKKKILKNPKNFSLSPSVMSTWLQGYVITVNLSGKNDP